MLAGACGRKALVMWGIWGMWAVTGGCGWHRMCRTRLTGIGSDSRRPTPASTQGRSKETDFKWGAWRVCAKVGDQR